MNKKLLLLITNILLLNNANMLSALPEALLPEEHETVPARQEMHAIQALNNAAQGQYDTMWGYITMEGNINIQDANGIGFLHIAVARGDTDEVEKLLQKKANPDIQNILGMSPLHIACSVPVALGVINYNVWIKQAPEITKLLLDHGADANLKNELGLTPLHLATSTVAKDEDISKLGIKIPTKWGKKQIKESLKATAAIAGTLLPVMASEGTVLGVAGAAILAAQVAIIGGIVTTVVIAKQIASKVKRINSLLAHGASVNTQDNFGNTPLHYLATGKLIEIGLKGARGAVLMADKIISGGANLDLKNDLGFTAYDIAKADRRLFLLPVLKPKNLRILPWRK